MLRDLSPNLRYLYDTINLKIPDVLDAVSTSCSFKDALHGWDCQGHEPSTRSRQYTALMIGVMICYDITSFEVGGSSLLPSVCVFCTSKNRHFRSCLLLISIFLKWKACQDLQYENLTDSPTLWTFNSSWRGFLKEDAWSSSTMLRGSSSPHWGIIGDVIKNWWKQQNKGLECQKENSPYIPKGNHTIQYTREYRDEWGGNTKARIYLAPALEN